MAQENYVEGCSMQRPYFLELNGFCFWKVRFDTYINSKDIDLWQVIQNDDFYFEVKDEETKLMKETPYELLKDNEKKQLGKNEESKMTIYNALPRKEYEHVFMCKTTKEVWHTLVITHYTMADVNVNAPAEQAPAIAPPARTDDQILPRIRWVPIGKSN
ncbi:hypothetical protein Tco_1179316 [Tanacetum coccineum]